MQYFGHRVDAKGLHPVEKKVKAYLSLLNYFNKFLPNLATLLAPL